MPPLLFITRKWHGIGGMQRYSHDLWRGLQELHQGPVVLCKTNGFFSVCTFPFRALWRSYQMRQQRGWVHLGDCAMLPIGVLLRVCFGL